MATLKDPMAPMVATMTGSYWATGNLSVVQENRDYFLECPNPDGTCQMSDWGTKGIGVGLLSARPTNCTTLRVGYWATDTNTLYVCSSLSPPYWTEKYKPYQYPHPLDQ
jgi:hypothetical protein